MINDKIFQLNQVISDDFEFHSFIIYYFYLLIYRSIFIENFNRIRSKKFL